MNDIRLCYFRFKKPTSAKSFFRYRVKNFSPYNDMVKLIGSVRYRIISNFENYVDYRKIFAYSDKKENYIYTYEKIKSIPDFSKEKAEVEFVDKIEIPVSENTDLYSEWIQYYVYHNISESRKYDCHEEHNFYLDMPTENNNLKITLRRHFFVKAKVMTDGTSYIGIDISTQYYSYFNVHERINNGEKLTGMEVKCAWQGFDKTYEIEEVSDRKINETSKSGFNLYKYWELQAPYRLKGIDPNNTKTVIVMNHKENRKEKYIPQSLYLVFRRETVAAYDRKFSRDTDKLMKLPMFARLQIMLEFINDLNSQTNGIVIPEPVIAGELGYSVYNASLNMPLLSTGNNIKIKSNEKYKTFSNGFYRLPSELCISFMYFEEKIIECREAAVVIMEYLTKGKTNGIEDIYLKKPLLPATFTKVSYPYKQNYDEFTLKKTARKISENKKTNFIICFVPMESDDDDYSYDTSRYDIFKKVFSEINMPSQMISTNFLNQLKTGKDVKSYLQNIALGILSKSGGVPWILSQPFSDIDCFVGIDVSMQSKGIHYPACSVCFDGNGNLLGYYTTEKAQSGEKINGKTLTDIFDKILIEYNDRNGCYPKHIVIHRDGFSNESDEWYEEYFSKKSIIYDIVEVKKNISERLLDMKNPNGMNPDSSVCVIKDNEALIVTTQRQASYGGAPQPLEIVHKHGSLSMNQIVTQIHALSELHVGSTQSTRLPMTTYYADKICKAGEYIPKGEVYNKLYFL